MRRKKGRFDIPCMFKRTVKRGKTPDHEPDINRAKLAEEAGLSRSHVSNILCGRIMPTMGTIKRLSMALNMSLDDTVAWLDYVRAKYKQ